MPHRYSHDSEHVTLRDRLIDARSYALYGLALAINRLLRRLARWSPGDVELVRRANLD